jgi:FtsH-binding integral membrane protein
MRIVAQPMYQAVVIFLFSAFLALIDRQSGVLGVGATGKNSPWVMMTVGILFYAVASSVLSLRAKNQNKYWRNAMMTFVGLMLVSGLTAMLISGQSIDEAGSFRWLFVVLAIGYLVFCAIVRLIKKIVDIAIKQDDRLRGE